MIDNIRLNQINGIGYTLIPVVSEDAKYIVDVRSNPNVITAFPASDVNLSNQIKWLEIYSQSNSQLYYKIRNEKSSKFEGLISLYSIDSENLTAEWGRWVLSPDSLAAVESARLIYHLAFDVLNLDSVYCRTLATNKSVLSFHDSCSPISSEYESRAFVVDGVEFPAYRKTFHKSQWETLNSYLTKISSRLNRIKS